ncbi:hypothetical protein ABPG72_005908 [Tetrahymena utriculariae]
MTLHQEDIAGDSSLEDTLCEQFFVKDFFDSHRTKYSKSKKSFDQLTILNSIFILLTIGRTLFSLIIFILKQNQIILDRSEDLVVKSFQKSITFYIYQLNQITTLSFSIFLDIQKLKNGFVRTIIRCAHCTKERRILWVSSCLKTKRAWCNYHYTSSKQNLQEIY